MTNMRTPGKRGNAEDLFDSLTREEIITCCQAAAAWNDTHHKKGRKGTGEKRRQLRAKESYERGELFKGSGRDLHAGLLLAEKLIRDKGGIVPVREKFDDYLARVGAGQAVSETA